MKLMKFACEKKNTFSLTSNSWNKNLTLESHFEYPACLLWNFFQYRMWGSLEVLDNNVGGKAQISHLMSLFVNF